MAKNGRTKNSIYNVTTGLMVQFFTIVLQFIVKTVFIRTLGKDYMGINGLFSNIFMMLSLAEVGIGSTVLYRLYKPALEDDKERIKTLLDFYRKVYKVIGIVITLLGLSLLPFLPSLIKDYNRFGELGINPLIIFGLYLIQAISSYMFFAYRTAIIRANQKNYVLNIIYLIFQFVTCSLQIIELLTLKDFYLYVIIVTITNILQSIACAYMATRMYPYISEKPKKKIEKTEAKEIFKNCYALMIYKLNSIVMKASDNIIISKFIGLAAVGVYSNYNYISQATKGIVGKFYESLVDSIGNLHASDDVDKEYLIYRSMNLLTVFLGGITFVGVACLSSTFINLWIGKEWVLSPLHDLIMASEILIISYRNFLSEYRSSYGLFEQGKYRPLLSVALKLVTSSYLVNKIGVPGAIAGTVISELLTTMWYDPLIIHQYGFKNKYKVYGYYLKNVFYVILIVCSYLICNNLFTYIHLSSGWLTFIIQGIIVVIITSIILLIPSIKTDEFKFIKQKLLKQTRR